MLTVIRYSQLSNQAKITAISGEQANVAAIVPSSGPEIGTISNIAINGDGGSNYRTAPEIFIDDPFYGGVATLSVNSQNTNAEFTPGNCIHCLTGICISYRWYWASIQVIISASNQDVQTVNVLSGGSKLFFR